MLLRPQGQEGGSKTFALDNEHISDCLLRRRRGADQRSCGGLAVSQDHS